MDRLRYRFFLLAAVLFSVTACSEYDLPGLFTSVTDSSDQRFEQSRSASSHQVINVEGETYTLYVMSDAHIDEKTSNLDSFVSEYLDDTHTAPFAICLGDLVKGNGHMALFAQHTAPIASEGRKLFCVAGNHDLFFDQWKEYLEYWNSSSYTFEAVTPSGARDLFIALDSANGMLGRKQREWLESVLEGSLPYRNVIVFTHTHFFRRDSSPGLNAGFTMEETMDLASLFGKYVVDMVLQGHSHHRDLTSFKGVDYLRVDALEEDESNASYALLEIGDEISFSFRPVGLQEPDRKN